ncbi:MAG: hypothetical protein JWR41_1730 [Modestobacter sp.]|nr:hypothetical protein [Modestobacter sp.]
MRAVDLADEMNAEVEAVVGVQLPVYWGSRRSSCPLRSPRSGSGRWPGPGSGWPSSVALDCVVHAACPVMVVHPEAAGRRRRAAPAVVVAG